MTTKVILKDVRIAFIDALWTPKEYTPGDGKPRHSATFLITPGSANDKAIRAAIELEAATCEGWGKTKEIRLAKLKSIETNTNKYCYQNGDLKEYDGFPGNWFVAAHSKTKPLIVDRIAAKSDAERQDGRAYTSPNSRGEMFPILEPKDGLPFAGCFVNGTIEIYAQDGDNWGMRCSLKGVQYLKKGDAFGAGRPANPDDFEDLGVENEEEADLAG